VDEEEIQNGKKAIKTKMCSCGIGGIQEVIYLLRKNQGYLLQKRHEKPGLLCLSDYVKELNKT